LGLIPVGVECGEDGLSKPDNNDDEGDDQCYPFSFTSSIVNQPLVIRVATMAAARTAPTAIYSRTVSELT
jgi:hypothetical protein